MLRFQTRFGGGIGRLGSFKRWRNVSAGEVIVVPPTEWDVTPAPTFVEGDGGTYDVAATGPVDLGYLAGGTYEVDSSGNPLPAGVTLSSDGTLTNVSGTAGVTNGVVFAYDEPIAGDALPTFTLYNNTITGTLPYMATVFPLEGAVPAGKSLSSLEDPTMRASIINTYPDGSARVAVIAGQMSWASSNITKSLALQVTTVSDTPLTTATIATRFTSGITINFPPNGSGPQTLNSWGSPHRIWWANSQVICARYILSCGLGVMEAHIDVHAFATGHTFVEFVVENGKINCGLTTPPMLPAPNRETYSGATFVINGATVATVNTPVQGTYGAPYYTTGTHEKFRAFYVGAWLNQSNVATPIRGTSDPFIELSHDLAHMQAHPIWPGKNVRARSHNPQVNYYRDMAYQRPGVSLSTQPYADDLYQPWDIGRFKGAYMGNPGGISQLQHQEWRYVQGPDRYTRRAVIATTLGYLSYYINYRDVTGDVPSFARIGNKFRNAFGYFPFEGGVQPDYSIYHTSSAGLMGFMCQPSPCFIELMQKKSVWDCTYNGTVPVVSSTYGGQRGLAWVLRHLSQAVMATPDGHPWKASGEDALYQQIMFTDSWRTNGQFGLNVTTYDTPTVNIDPRDDATHPAYETGFWMHTWLVSEIVKVHRTKLLTNSSWREDVRVLKDWLLVGAARMVNEQAHTGGWRYQCQYQAIGSNGAYPGRTDGSSSGYQYTINIGSFTNWDDMAQWFYPDYPPPSVNGTWMVAGDTGVTGYVSAFTSSTVANHPSEFDYCTAIWPWICMAAEEGVAGSDAMWTTVHDGITNLTTWLNGFAADLEDGIWPRNKPLDK